MKSFPFITCLGLTLSGILYGVETLGYPAWTKQQPDDPRYKFHEAATLSGIDLKANKKSSTFTLKFDQRLYEPGILEVKNAANQVLFTRALAANNEPLTRTFQLGRLKPGLYSIVVKTTDTTFWKKVRIRK